MGRFVSPSRQNKGVHSLQEEVAGKQIRGRGGDGAGAPALEELPAASLCLRVAIVELTLPKSTSPSLMGEPK